MKRPGRIDRVIAVGALRSRAVAAVASGLLPEDVSLPPAELGKALDRTTPAEIREITATAIRLCLPEPGQNAPPPLDIATIERARASLKRPDIDPAIRREIDEDTALLVFLGLIVLLVGNTIGFGHFDPRRTGFMALH